MKTVLPPGELARLRQALTVEARQNFPNVQGKASTFAEFISSELERLVPELLEAQKRGAISLQSAFQRYKRLSLEERQKVVESLGAYLSALEPAKKVLASEDDWRDRPVQFVKGIGPRIASMLAKLGVQTVDQLLHYYPRQHLDYQQRSRIATLKTGETVTLWGTIKRVEAYNPRPTMSVLTVHVSDGTGTISARWFGQKKNKFQLDKLKEKFPLGRPVLLSGTAKQDGFSGRMVFDRPETQLLDTEDDTGADSLHMGRIVPIYPLTDGLHLKALRKAIRSALDLYLPFVIDPLPSALRSSQELMPLKMALELIHFPRSPEDLKAARQRLVFDELFWLQLGLAYKRAQLRKQSLQIELPATGKLIDRLRGVLPFQLTGAQERVFEEIRADLAAPAPMNRLVQGDVGSGKTVVALMTLLIAIENGFQGALMAPTEILADQHHIKIGDWLNELGLKTALLVGRQGKKERHATLLAIEAGLIDVVIGTHALISERVKFKNLGLVVIDEQHRFGVKQRALLRAKGLQPQVLYMTATPIPRTLALTLHGDLDVSSIDELPPGRKPVSTRWTRGKKAQSEVWNAVIDQLNAGRQCYVVYPLIEESDKLDVQAATEAYERLQLKELQGFRLALLHGAMPSEKKEKTIGSFRRGELDVLVSTTVIEVGVDVPNASVMIIENAERFGLAQLHQLRGRVGRGVAQSYCFLFSDSKSESTRQRLSIMEATNDGFVIAEQDLALRGPGEFLGTRQSGMPDLVLADLAQDTQVLEIARKAALTLIARDPDLEHHRILKDCLFRNFQANLDFLEA